MSTTLPPIVIPRPPLPPQPTNIAEKGKALYTANACDYCHGPGAERWTMSVPDLRRSSAETHAEFLAIVIGGSRSAKGMPQFTAMTAEEGEAIHAFLINQAWGAYHAQQAAKP